jgi:protein-tyrosine phosphatase
MKEEIELLLPLIKMGKVSESDIQEVTDRIRQSIKNDASKGKELGELLSQIKHASKAKALHTDIHWVQVGNGFLAIGHKPGGKISFEGLKNEGTSAVLTLLNENEGAVAIGHKLRAVNIEWIWFPFSASKPHDGEAIVHIYDLYAQLSSLMNASAKIYIHCSAGIHRTGMITYGFLRYLGKGKTEAFELLHSLREVTAAQVGEDRLLWADQFNKP